MKASGKRRYSRLSLITWASFVGRARSLSKEFVTCAWNVKTLIFALSVKICSNTRSNTQ